MSSSNRRDGCKRLLLRKHVPLAVYDLQKEERKEQFGYTETDWGQNTRAARFVEQVRRAKAGHLTGAGTPEGAIGTP